MQARIERLAPGFGSLIQARRVLGPRELEARNANLIGGAVGGGTAQLHQELVFRPVPGWAAPRPGWPASTSARRPRTPAAACTARRAATPPGPRCCTTGCASGVAR